MLLKLKMKILNGETGMPAYADGNEKEYDTGKPVPSSFFSCEFLDKINKNVFISTGFNFRK